MLENRVAQDCASKISVEWNRTQDFKYEKKKINIPFKSMFYKFFCVIFFLILWRDFNISFNIIVNLKKKHNIFISYIFLKHFFKVDSRDQTQKYIKKYIKKFIDVYLLSNK